MLLRIKYKTFERPPLNRFRCTQRTRTIVVLVLCTALTFRCILFDFGWKNEFFALSFAKGCLSGWKWKIWKTSCELFNLSCSVLNQLHLNCFENDTNASANNAFQESLFWNEWMNELVDGQRANSFWAATKTGSKWMHTRWIFNIVYFHCCYLAYAENADARGVTYFKLSSALPDHPFTVQRTAILSSLSNSVYAKRWNSKQYRAELSWADTEW